MRTDVQPGFTLLELLLVVSLVALLAMLAWPDFGGAERTEHLKESARRMQAMVAMCRAESMNETCVYRIEIRLDGSVRCKRQADPLLAPHLYIAVREGWARINTLMDDVWVEAVQVLPEGPAPILIIDEKLELPEMEIEPVPIEEFEDTVLIDFAPDGSTASYRWVLRDERGRAVLQTLDGRLGRVTVEPWESVPADSLQRPEPVEEEEEEPEFDMEDYR